MPQHFMEVVLMNVSEIHYHSVKSPSVHDNCMIYQITMLIYYILIVSVHYIFITSTIKIGVSTPFIFCSLNI